MLKIDFNLSNVEYILNFDPKGSKTNNCITVASRNYPTAKVNSANIYLILHDWNKTLTQQNLLTFKIHRQKSVILYITWLRIVEYLE